jgi:hypothetical protein
LIASLQQFFERPLKPLASAKILSFRVIAAAADAKPKRKEKKTKEKKEKGERPGAAPAQQHRRTALFHQPLHQVRCILRSPVCSVDTQTANYAA